MIDPPRLLEGSASDFEHEILASALHDAGSMQAFRRVRAAIGAGIASGIAVESASASAAAAAKTVGSAPLLIAKWVALGALAGTVVTGTAAVVSSPPRPAQPPSALEPHKEQIPVLRTDGNARTDALHEVALPPGPVEPPPRSPDAMGEPANAGRAAPSHGVPRHSAEKVTESAAPAQSDAPALAALPAEATAVSAPAAAPAGTLAEEVVLVDAIRASLARRDAATALVGIARHDAAFPGGALALDVAVLRVRALFMVGRTQEATREAERVIAANPTGPYAARVRQILGAANP